jgi:hypothetical protein
LELRALWELFGSSLGALLELSGSSLQLRVWTALNATRLSREDKMKALSSLLFLKEKQTRKIKGWACINKALQRAYIPKEDDASPTVSTESMFVTAAIATSKKRKVIWFDIPSVFVNTDVDKDVLMVLKGELADMMI